ncbi:MAG: NlpC/P60 family protein [Lachnospiraceae bacterium]
MNIKKIGKIVSTATLACSLMVTPVFAAPSVDGLEQNKQAAQGEVNSIQEELTKLLVKMDELESELITKGMEITQSEADLQVAQEKEQKQYEDMKLRIRYMYEEGDATFLSKMLESGTIADALNQVEYVQNVHGYDRKMLNEYIDIKQKVADLKDTLEKEMKNLNTMQISYESEKGNLNTTLETKRAEVSNFDEQIQAAAAEAARQREAEVQKQAQVVAKTDGVIANVVAGAGTNQNENVNHPDTNPTPPSSSGGNVEEDTGSNDESYVPPSNGSGGAAIVNAAYGFLGVPYVWGGESGSGVDCSGLVLLCHEAIGVGLDHSSGSQGGGGQAVGGMSNALPGDVVCYSGHVGIYIGGGQMIHAPQPGDVVKVANVYGSPWFRRYW